LVGLFFFLPLGYNYYMVNNINFFVYVVNTDIPAENIFSGDIGVGFTSMQTGICDAPYGTMYVAPTSIIPIKDPYNASEYMIRKAVLQYFGVKDRWDR